MDSLEGKSILKNRVYLYLTEFFAGMAVMAVELGASRLLDPYFSSSQIVWTIIIGTIMIAMALLAPSGRGSMDCCDSGCGEIYCDRHIRASGYDGKREFSDYCCILILYGDFCISVVPVRHCHAFPCEVYSRQPR